ncbi:MAG: hypothetical protein RLZZ200_1120 [Pseudomonadota bacterium]|jgi:hypothetical protein
MEIPSSNDPKSWFGVIAAAFTGLLLWNTKRHVAKQDDHSLRIRALETDRVTKGDITAVYERIEDLSKQSARQHEMSLRVIAAAARSTRG